MQTMAEFVARHNITLKVMGNHGLQTDKDGWAHVRYTVRVIFEGRRLITSWRAGTGLPELTDADVADVLNSLRIDAESYIMAPSFRDFAGEYGFDADSRAAERTWRACQRMATRLESLLGGDIFQELLEGTEPL